MGERSTFDVSVAEITRAAGVSSGLFYWYFDDVDDLLRHAFFDAVDAIRLALDGAASGYSEPLERIYARLRVGVGLAEANPLVPFLLDAESRAGASPPVEAAVSRGEVIMREMLHDVAEGQVQGSVRADVPAFHLVSCLRSLIADTVARWVRGQLNGSLDELADSVARFAVQGVAADADAARRAADVVAGSAGFASPAAPALAPR